MLDIFGMNQEFMACRPESSDGASQFNILRDNFYTGAPMTKDEMPYMLPQSMHSDGSQLYNPEDPFNPTQGNDLM